MCCACCDGPVEFECVANEAWNERQAMKERAKKKKKENRISIQRIKGLYKVLYKHETQKL